MADIELVIKVNENTYHRIISGFANEDDAVLFEDLFKNGIPLANDSERAEVQAYFAGQTYGWEQERKALIEDVKEEIDACLTWDMFDEYGNETRLHKELMDILDNIGEEEE